MIDEKRTFEEFGYISNTLSCCSNKKVWRICDKCNITKLIEYKHYRNLCRKCTQQSRHLSRGPFNIEYFQHLEKSIKNNYINELKTFEEFGYYSIDLSCGSSKKVWRKCQICGKEKLIEYQACRKICFLCYRKISTYRHKQSRIQSGYNNARWRGGKKLRIARKNAKRKQFGFIPHNKPHRGFDGHHIDFNHVIFIPTVLHRSVYHSNIRNINMDKINAIVCDWYLASQGINIITE